MDSKVDIPIKLSLAVKAVGKEVKPSKHAYIIHMYAYRCMDNFRLCNHSYSTTEQRRANRLWSVTHYLIILNLPSTQNENKVKKSANTTQPGNYIKPSPLDKKLRKGVGENWKK